MKKMRVRSYMPSDARALSRIFHDSVHHVGLLDYSAEQVAVWSPKPEDPKKFAERVSDGRDVLVAVDADNVPLGFIELEHDGHIDRFYCSPQYTGTGIGLALYKNLEGIANDRGVRSLYVEASEAAKRFFNKNGFLTERRHDFYRNGVHIHNYIMRKALQK